MNNSNNAIFFLVMSTAEKWKLFEHSLPRLENKTNNCKKN